MVGLRTGGSRIGVPVFLGLRPFRLQSECYERTASVVNSLMPLRVVEKSTCIHKPAQEIPSPVRIDAEKFLALRIADATVLPHVLQNPLLL